MKRNDLLTLNRPMLLSAAVAAILAAAAPSARAQSSTDAAASDAVLDEVFVTAQRREERSRDVPISIASISGEALEQTASNSLADISKLTPALRFDAAGSFFQPGIRGVGTAITTSGGGPNVGIYVDGFFSSNPEVADFQLMKVKNIQVLKGPQGTLFGRNTTGGAILVTTADPSTDPSAEVKLSYGRFGAVKAQAYATMGLSNSVAWDVEGLYSEGDGHTTNTITGNDREGAYSNWSFRTGLKADFTDSASMLLRYIHSELDDPSSVLTNAYVDENGEAGFFRALTGAGVAAYGTNDSTGRALVYPTGASLAFGVPVGSYATDPDQMTTPFQNSFTNNSDTVQLKLTFDLGFASLNSYTQYREDESLNLQDLDASAVPLFDIRLGIDDQTSSQEFVLSSTSDSSLQWTVGANYFQNRDTYHVDASFGMAPFIPYGGSSTLTKSTAGFVDMTYEFTPQFFLTAGARYSHDVVTDAFFFIPVVQSKVPVPDLKKNKVTPRLVLRFKPTEESSVYASFTQGYKAGILNVGGASLVPIQPEDINAFEVGYKFDNRTLSVDAAAYYYDYKNLQVSSFQSGQAQIRNAAKSEIWGLEAALRYKVSSAFNVSAAAAYTHARYKSFAEAPYYSFCDPTVVNPADQRICGPVGPGSLTQITTDASGYHMQRAPDLTGNLTASYAIPMGDSSLTLSGNVYYTSKVYFDPSQQFYQDGYALVGLRAAWTDPSDRLTLAVFGDNLTDERYRTQVLFNTLGIGSTWNAGLTWGGQVGVKF